MKKIFAELNLYTFSLNTNQCSFSRNTYTKLITVMLPLEKNVFVLDAMRGQNIKCLNE